MDNLYIFDSIIFIKFRYKFRYKLGINFGINCINLSTNYLTGELFSTASSTFLNLFALTNLADLKDYDEDLLNGINTYLLFWDL